MSHKYINRIMCNIHFDPLGKLKFCPPHPRDDGEFAYLNRPIRLENEGPVILERDLIYISGTIFSIEWDHYRDGVREYCLRMRPDLLKIYQDDIDAHHEPEPDYFSG